MIGNSTTGASFTGGESTDGKIVDISFLESPIDAAFTFSHVGVDNTFTDHRVAIGLDGDLIALLDAGDNPFSIGGLSDGGHTLQVRPIRPTTIRIPDLHGDPYGSRAWLTWPANTETDLVAYRIFGSISPAAKTELTRVTAITLSKRILEAPETGTGTGRVSIEGEYSGDTVNASYTLQINSGGYRHNMSGSYSTVVTFRKDQRVFLDDGIAATFHDAPADYDNGDEWAFLIGPKTSWLSDELVSGSWDFEIKGEDSAGNLSTASTEIANLITKRPDPVVSPSLVFNGTSIVVSWTDPADGSFDGVSVYSNISNATGTLRDNIIESGAWNSYASGVETFTIAAPIDGLNKFYIRSKNSSGVESQDVLMLSIDTTGTANNTALNSPALLKATPSAGGTVTLSWLYDWNGGGDCSSFQFYQGDSSGAVLADLASGTEYAPEPTLAATASVGLESYSFTFAADFSADPTVYFAVRASDGSIQDANVSVVSVDPDATAPSAPTAVLVISN